MPPGLSMRMMTPLTWFALARPSRSLRVASSPVISPSMWMRATWSKLFLKSSPVQKSAPSAKRTARTARMRQRRQAPLQLPAVDDHFSLAYRHGHPPRSDSFYTEKLRPDEPIRTEIFVARWRLIPCLRRPSSSGRPQGCRQAMRPNQTSRTGPRLPSHRRFPGP